MILSFRRTVAKYVLLSLSLTSRPPLLIVEFLPTSFEQIVTLSALLSPSVRPSVHSLGH